MNHYDDRIVYPNETLLPEGKFGLEKESIALYIFGQNPYERNAYLNPILLIKIVIKKGYLAFVDYWNYRLKTYNKYLIRTGKK